MAFYDHYQKTMIVYEKKDIFVDPETLDLMIQTDTVRKGQIYIVANTLTTINDPAFVEVNFEVFKKVIGTSNINNPPFFSTALPPKMNITVTASQLSLPLPDILDALNNTFTVDASCSSLDVTYD